MIGSIASGFFFRCIIDMLGFIVLKREFLWRSGLSGESLSEQPKFNPRFPIFFFVFFFILIAFGYTILY